MTETPTTSADASGGREALGVEEAGDAYLQLVDTKNEAVAAASRRFETAQLDGDLTEASAAMSDFGRANEEFAERVASVSWPGAVDEDVTILIDAARVEADASDAYADSILAFDDGAATAEDTAAAARRLFDATSATLTAAGPVRETLGLAPVQSG